MRRIKKRILTAFLVMIMSVGIIGVASMDQPGCSTSLWEKWDGGIGDEQWAKYIYNPDFYKEWKNYVSIHTNHPELGTLYAPSDYYDERIIEIKFLKEEEGWTDAQINAEQFCTAFNNGMKEKTLERMLNAGYMLDHIRMLKEEGRLDADYKYKGKKRVSSKIYAWDGTTYKKAMGDEPFVMNVVTTSTGKMTYSSSNKNVATVSSKGKVTLKGVGTATITVKTAADVPYKAGSKKITVTVSPAKVTGITATVTDAAIQLSWGKSAGADRYEVYRKTGDGEWEKLGTVKNPAYTDTTAEPGETYGYRIRAYKKVSGKTYYAKYSGTKTVEIPKTGEA